MAAAGETEHRHARRLRRDDAGCAVLDGDRALGRRAHLRRGIEKDVGRGLAARHQCRAEDRRRREPTQQIRPPQLPQEIVRQAARRHAFGHRQQRQHRLEAGDGLELALEQFERMALHRRVEIFRQRTAEIRGEGGVHVPVAHAGETLGDALGGHDVAEGGQGVDDGAAGDDLAVDQYAVAIEDDEIDAGMRRAIIPWHQRRWARRDRIWTHGWRATSAHARHWAPQSAWS